MANPNTSQERREAPEKQRKPEETTRGSRPGSAHKEDRRQDRGQKPADRKYGEREHPKPAVGRPEEPKMRVQEQGKGRREDRSSDQEPDQPGKPMPNKMVDEEE